MERLARVAAVWNWLPGFRAVAETESVHEAARQLSMSPSSLSRTINVLEDRLGRTLFSRGGGVLTLTPLGRELLDVIRTAMRAVDDVLAAGAGVVRVAAPGDLAAICVIPAVAQLQLPARVVADVDADPAGRLLRGELDLVVTCEELDDRRLLAERIGELRVGLYVASRHPHPPPTLEDARRWSFVAYRTPGGLADHAARLDTTIALEVTDARDAAAAAANGELVVALPDRLAEALNLPLRRLAFEAGAPVPVHAIRRRSLGPEHPADQLVAAIRALITAGSAPRGSARE